MPTLAFNTLRKKIFDLFKAGQHCVIFDLPIIRAAHENSAVVKAWPLTKALDYLTEGIDTLYLVDEQLERVMFRPRILPPRAPETPRAAIPQATRPPLHDFNSLAEHVDKCLLLGASTFTVQMDLFLEAKAATPAVRHLSLKDSLKAFNEAFGTDATVNEEAQRITFKRYPSVKFTRADLQEFDAGFVHPADHFNRLNNAFLNAVPAGYELHQLFHKSYGSGFYLMQNGALKKVWDRNHWQDLPTSPA